MVVLALSIFIGDVVLDLAKLLARLGAAAEEDSTSNNHKVIDSK